MDLRKLKTLIELVDESNVEELEMTEGDSKVRIVKSTSFQRKQALAMQSHQNFSDHHRVTIPIPDVVNTDIKVPEGNIIKSPMVGTFYRSSAPSLAAFVEIGSIVKKGDTLCIIEAMKLLNEIAADHAGIVQEILVENGHPVEFGQLLFIIN